MDEIALLGRNIRFARKVRGWSQTKLASKAGTPVSWLCLLEKGRSHPRLVQVVCVARALGIELHRLLSPKFMERSSGRVDDYPDPK